MVAACQTWVQLPQVQRVSTKLNGEHDRHEGSFAGSWNEPYHRIPLVLSFKCLSLP